jgi:hypothetical protein
MNTDPETRILHQDYGVRPARVFLPYCLFRFAFTRGHPRLKHLFGHAGFPAKFSR